MKDELRSFACVVIYSHIVCECAFLSAARSLPSGPVRVQSSQNRHCRSLYAAERPPKLQNVGFSTLTVFFFFNDFTFFRQNLSRVTLFCSSGAESGAM